MEVSAEVVHPFLLQLREAVQSPGVAAVAACAITGALLEAQIGVRVPLSGKTARYVPAFWAGPDSRESILVGRSRFWETGAGEAFIRALLMLSDSERLCFFLTSS